MNICKLKIEEITPYEKNAKIHTEEQINQIKQSITEFGMNDPIAVWRRQEHNRGRTRKTGSIEAARLHRGGLHKAGPLDR